mgnify:CR=1 FL=1
MSLVNDVRLIGHCGINAQCQDYGYGRVYCRLPVYTEHWSRLADGREKRYKELHYCVFFGRLAKDRKSVV